MISEVKIKVLEESKGEYRQKKKNGEGKDKIWKQYFLCVP